MNEKKWRFPAVATALFCAIGMSACSSESLNASRATEAEAAARLRCQPNTEIKGRRACVSYEAKRSIRIVRLVFPKSNKVYSEITQECPFGRSSGYLDVKSRIVSKDSPQSHLVVSTDICDNGKLEPKETKELNTFIVRPYLPPKS